MLIDRGHVIVDWGAASGEGVSRILSAGKVDEVTGGRRNPDGLRILSVESSVCFGMQVTWILMC